MDLIMTGLSHRTAPVEEREKLAFQPDETIRFLRALRQEHGLWEALLLSTCHRTELYACVSEPSGVTDRAERLHGLLSEWKKSADPVPSDRFFFHHAGSEAVRHLFSVICGLDSLALGENQIQGQVKRAYRLACEARTNGVILNKLMHWSFRVGKRARTETAIDAGSVSVGSMMVDQAAKMLNGSKKPTVLILGAGEVGEMTAGLLARRNLPGRLIIAGRNLERIAGLAGRFGAEATDWEHLPDAMEAADVMICAMGADRYVVGRNLIIETMARRPARRLIIFDAGVPRNIEPHDAYPDQVQLLGIDSLQEAVERNMSRRCAEVKQVEAIIAEETCKFAHWHRTLRSAPIIKGLRSRFERIRQDEIDRCAAALDEESLAVVDRMTQAMLSKFLDVPMSKLRDFSEDSQTGMARLDAVRQVFGLENLEVSHEDQDRDTR